MTWATDPQSRHSSGRYAAYRSSRAAAAAARLALLPDDGPTGEFFSWDGTLVPWQQVRPHGRPLARILCWQDGGDLGKVAGHWVTLASVDQLRLLRSADVLRFPAARAEPASGRR
jgi:hypothetical protein